MQALPLIVALLLAVAIAPPALRALAEGPLARENYRAALLPCPAGLIVLAAALISLGPLSLAQQLAPNEQILNLALAGVLPFVVGVAALGLADDVFSSHARGWRGHGRALLRGGFSTGALKAAGTAGLALFFALFRGVGTGEFLLIGAVLVLATNAFNLLDLRPGRSFKAFVLLGAGIVIGAGSHLHTLWILGPLVGPVLVVGVYDLRERALLGDTGSNLIGALAGTWMALTMSDTALVAALIVLAAINAYGEFRSISELIERTPLLRELDSWGRPSHVTDA